MAQSNSKPPMGHNFGLEGTQAKPPSYGKNGLPPLSPLPPSESSLASSSSVKDVSMEEVDVSSRCPPLGGSSSYKLENAFRGYFENLPPRNGHRRSNSDVPLGFDAFIRTSPGLVPISGQGVIRGPTNGNDKSGTSEAFHLEKQERGVVGDCDILFRAPDERKYEGEVRDDFYGSYITRDYVSGGFDSCNDKGKIVSKEHGTGIHLTNKRSAAVDLAPAAHHCRSLSVDSAFGSLNFGDQSPHIPSSLENHRGHLSSIQSASENSARFSLVFGNGEFTESELKRIKMDERLAEIALLDPKRAKRILANRLSAARSKERKMRYTSELEHKVQALQTEAASLSAQLTILQKEFTELTNHNNELKFRLQAMEQQALLRDALHEALTAEVQHLKLATAEIGEDGANSCMIQQVATKHHMLQLQHHQSNHLQQFSVGTPKSSTTTTTTTTATSASA